MIGAGVPLTQNAGDTADDHHAAARLRPSWRSNYLLRGPRDRQASLLDEILKVSESQRASVRATDAFQAGGEPCRRFSLPALMRFSNGRRVSDRVQRSNRYHQEYNIVRSA